MQGYCYGSFSSWQGKQHRRRLRSYESKVVLDPHERSKRICAISLALLFAGITVALRLYYLQSADHQRWLKLALKQQQSSVEIQGARGTVVDRMGRILAVSVETRAVGAHPPKIEDRERFAKTLAPALELSKADVLSMVSQPKPFVWLARGCSRSVEQALRGVPVDELSIFPEFKRSYPQGKVGSSILGKVSRDGYGQSGVELEYEKELSASNHNILVRRDAKGRLVSVADRDDSGGGAILASLALGGRFFGGSHFGQRESFIAPETKFRHEGAVIELTIDTIIQGILEEEFEQGRADSEAARVFGVLMEAGSGEILAMAQTGGVYPN